MSFIYAWLCLARLHPNPMRSSKGQGIALCWWLVPQLNPLCKFMTNELLFAVFCSPNIKRHKICLQCYFLCEYDVSVGIKWVSEFFPTWHICKSQKDNAWVRWLHYVRFQSACSPKCALEWKCIRGTQKAKSKEKKRATVAKEAIKHKAYR